VTPRDGLVTAFRDGPVTTLARAPESSDAFSPVNSDKKLEIPSVRPSLPERARDGLAVTPRDGPDVTQGRHGVVTPQPASVTAPTVTTPNPGGTDGRTDGLSVLSLPDVQAIVKRRSGGKINTRLIGTAEDGFAGVLAQLERQNCTLEDFGVLADMVLTGDLEREYRGQLSLQAMLGRPDDRGNYSAGGLDAALQIASKCALRRKAKGLPPRMPPVRTQPKGPAPIKTPAQPVLPTAALGAIASDWRAKHNRPAGGGQ
jgi:hypothetical protein